jgi:hypothetical protein
MNRGVHIIKKNRDSPWLRTGSFASNVLFYYINTTYIHTYHSRFILEGVAEVSQIFLRDTHVLPKLVSYEGHCRRDRW